MMKDFTRREAITRIAVGGAGVALFNVAGAEAQGQMPAPAAAQAFRGQHQPKPLPFDPAKLKGLSEKLIRSHWENNYGGAVKP